jgi:hypothetical protein
MSTLPDSAMKAAASEVIDLVGTSMTPYRKVAGTWTAQTAIMVKLKRGSSDYTRIMAGVENIDAYKGMAKYNCGLQKADRFLIDSVYYEVNSLFNLPTHVEFSLRETGEGS